MRTALIPPFSAVPRKAGANAARETKFAETDFSEVSADGTFFGYASIFEEPDLGHDVVMPGAFAKSLKARGASGVRMLFQHDPASPIGVWQSIREDSRGLLVRGRLMTEVARAREVLALMRAGAIDGLSIGFRTVRARTEAKTGLRRLLEVDLWEISIVTFPMLPGARVSAVKGASEIGLAAAMRRVARAMRAG
jgi:HK97 family phage prohead protease